MTNNLAPLEHESTGKYFELVERPNPHGYVLAFLPALGSWLLKAEREKGVDLTPTEVERICDQAPVVALLPEQVEKLRADRGYNDVVPQNLWESWCEFKST